MSPLDHCVYVYRCNEKLTILSFYVDDILLEGYYPNMMTKNKKVVLGIEICNERLGPATYILGIRITRYRDAKLLCPDQENYLELCERF
jgi:hypothetical protein